MKKVLLTLVMISVSLGLSAQRLWKISGNGLEKPSYIFGTHHLAPASIADSTAGFSEALDAVERVYGEVDMSLAMAPAAQMKVASMIMAPADSTLSKVFSPEELAEIDAYLQRAVGPAMTVAMFESYSPIMISIALEMAMMNRIIPDADPMNPLDGHIQQLAREKGKEIGGLETVEFQSALLYGSSIADQAASLLRTVRSGRDPLADSRMLYARYAEGDLDGQFGLGQLPYRHPSRHFYNDSGRRRPSPRRARRDKPSAQGRLLGQSRITTSKKHLRI